MGSSLAFVDGSVVNVALPALATDLQAGSTHLPWVINAYLLPVGALTLLGGSLGDAYGRRRLFLQGLAAFLLGSVVCGLAPSLAWLLGGRGLQGVGAALLMPNSLAILGSEFRGEARGRAIGTWSAVSALASALGPVMGGGLVDMAGWRLIFFINLPLGAAAAFLARKFMIDQTERTVVALDSGGALLVTVALGLLTWSLTEASSANRAAVLPAAAAGTILLGAFLRYERRQGERALLPLAIFDSRAFVGLNLLTFFLYASLGGLLVLLPFLLIHVEGWPATRAGAALLPIPALLGVGSRYMGAVAGRHGARMPLALGCGLVAGGFALFARLGFAPVDYWMDILPPTLLVALGLCACVAPLTTAIMASVEAGRAGLASGLNSAFARIAGLMATALLGFVFAQSSPHDFVIAFRVAAVLGGVSAAIAALSALLLIPSTPVAPN